MGAFKTMAMADNPRMVKHFLFCQFKIREYLEKELDEHNLKPIIFNKWHKRLSWAQSQLTERDKEIIEDLYKY